MTPSGTPSPSDPFCAIYLLPFISRERFLRGVCLTMRRPHVSPLARAAYAFLSCFLLFAGTLLPYILRWRGVLD